MMIRSRDSGADKQLAFEKSRFEYCEKIYDRELERKNGLEKRVQFHLSIITLILGGLFFNLDFFNTLGNLISSKSAYTPITNLIYVLLFISAIALLFSIAAMVNTMDVKKYKTEYPSKVISSLFQPESNYLDSEEETSLLRAIAMSYAIALEINREINDSKAKWIRVSSVSIFIVVLSLGSALSLAAFLLLRH